MIIDDIEKISENVDHHAYKFVLEIVMDRIGLHDQVALHAVSKDLALDGALRPRGFKDILPEKIALKLLGDESKASRLPIAAMFMFIQEQFSLNDSVMTDLRLKFINYISEHYQSELLKEYINTKMVLEMVKKQLAARQEFKDMRDVIKVRAHLVVDKFRKVIASTPADASFAVDSPSVLAYLTEYYKSYFGKGYGEDIKAIMTEKDFKLSNVGDDGDSVDFLNYMPMERKEVPKLKNFRSLAYNILAASKIMFNHKGEVFYDLWSDEKRKILTKRFKALSADMKKEFKGVKIGYSIKMADVNYKEHDNYKYRRGIYNERQTLLNLFCPDFDNGLQISRYEDTFNRLLERDSEFQEHNARQLFSHNSKMAKGKNYTNPDIFFLILLGYSSVKAIVNYCYQAGIDPLSVPSDIFRDASVYARTSSFDDYLATNTISNKLKLEAENEEEIPNLLSNEEVLKAVMGVPKTSDYDLQSLSRLKFCTIKELLLNASSREKTAIVELNRAQDFKTVQFKSVVNWLKDFRNKSIANYLNLLTFVGNMEAQLKGALGDPNFEIYSGKMITIDGRTVKLPTVWHSLDPKVTAILDKQNLSAVCFSLGTVGTPGYFYNAFRMANLAFNLTFRIHGMYDDICADSTTSISMFTKLERHRDVIDLPTKIDTIDSVTKLLQGSIQGISEKNPAYPLLVVSMCYVNEIPSEVNSKFISLYNILMSKMLSKPLEAIKIIRDEIYESLKVSGAISKSPFGKFHSRIMEKATILDIGLIADEEAAKHQEFKRYKALDEGHPSRFLVCYGNKAAYVMRDRSKFFVHISGRLYNPIMEGEPSAISVIRSTDTIRF